MPKVTIDDVAARAGVTKSTVSHALSGKRPVAPETRARIEAAIIELGYRPNPLARRLAAGRSRAIGLLFPPGQTAIGVYDMPFVSAAAVAAREAGYALVLSLSSSGLDEIAAGGLLDAAVVLHPAARDARIEALRAGDLPFALVGRTADNAGLSYVDVDLDAAVDACVDHLAGLGHRRIAFLRSHVRDGEAIRAASAYELACARRRLRLVAAACDTSVAGATAAARALLSDHPDLTGLVAWSEWAGWSAHLAAQEAGRRAPADLSIVCLGQGVAAELLPFDPTRVDLLRGRLAAEAVRLLLEQLDDDGEAAQHILLQGKLIEGATTAPPRAS